jgi:OHCU decarboxylase
MAARRPFANSAEIFAAADGVWRGLDREDWLEAFASHPQVGEKRAEKQIESATGQRLSNAWSSEEQSGIQQNSADVTAKLVAGNRAYRLRFGYIYIVCATGKTAPEMLAILEQRLQNRPSAELIVAAEEQRRITRLRLEKLLTQGAREKS